MRAVPRRTTRPADQRPPARQAAASPRTAARPSPLHRPVRHRRRTPRSRARRLLGIHISVAVAERKFLWFKQVITDGRVVQFEPEEHYDVPGRNSSSTSGIPAPTMLTSSHADTESSSSNKSRRTAPACPGSVNMSRRASRRPKWSSATPQVRVPTVDPTGLVLRTRASDLNRSGYWSSMNVPTDAGSVLPTYTANFVLVLCSPRPPSPIYQL